MDINKNVNLFINQHGAEPVQSALGGVERATEKAGRATGSFSKFIREQRTEQRTSNFLFREGAGALLVLANAMGGTNEKTKALTQSLNAGFATFQGLNFLLSGMKGPLGIVIALVGGMAAAWSSFGEGQKTANIIDEYIERLIKINQLTERQGILILELAKFQLKADLLKEESKRTTKFVEFGSGMSFAGGLHAPNFFVERSGADAQRVLSLQNEIAKIDEKILGFEKTITDERDKSAKKLEEQREALEAWMNFVHIDPSDPAGALKGRRAGRFTTPGTGGPVTGHQFSGIDQDENTEALKKDLALFIEMGEALGDTLRSSLGGAFEDIFGEANSLLEQFGQRLAEILGTRLIGSLLSFIPGIGPILGASFGTFGNVSGNSAPGSGNIDRQLSNPRFQLAMDRVQSNRQRLGR